MNHTNTATLKPGDIQDILVLLRIFEGWLLNAEPNTIRELDAYLKSEGMEATSATLLERLERLA